jgi:DHA2 family multidrug resistance protein-like MFS transporter
VTVVTAGLLLAAAGYALLVVDAGPSLFLVLAATITMSLGLAPVFTLATDLVVGAAPPERAGAAAAISETSAEFGGAVGIAIFGSIGTAVYGALMAESLPPGVEQATADTARGGLGAATAVAAQLPEATGKALLDVARDAFTQGLRVVSGIAAVVMVASAIVFAMTMRRSGVGTAAAKAEKANPNMAEKPAE